MVHCLMIIYQQQVTDTGPHSWLNGSLTKITVVLGFQELHVALWDRIGYCLFITIFPAVACKNDMIPCMTTTISISFF